MYDKLDKEIMKKMEIDDIEHFRENAKIEKFYVDMDLTFRIIKYMGETRVIRFDIINTQLNVSEHDEDITLKKYTKTLNYLFHEFFGKDKEYILDLYRESKK